MSDDDDAPPLHPLRRHPRLLGLLLQRPVRQLRRELEMSALANARRRTVLKTRGLELPEAFQISTIASAVNAIDRKRDPKTVRRLVSKALRVSGAA